MSPIGEPSSLDLMDTSCSLSFFYGDDTQPKVSTQKLPCGTAVGNFCPPVSRDAEAVTVTVAAKETLKRARVPATVKGCRKPLHDTSSCLTESIFPAIKRPKLDTDHSMHGLAEQRWLREAKAGNGHVAEQSRHPEKAIQHEEAESRFSSGAGARATLEDLLSIKPGRRPEMTQCSKFEESFDSEVCTNMHLIVTFP